MHDGMLVLVDIVFGMVGRRCVIQFAGRLLAQRKNLVRRFRLCAENGGT
jgi:hypothetical protein